MGEIKQKCQVPTPPEVVRQMLDQVGYISDLYGKRVLENSCGTGNFLVEIVRRYIEDCIKREYTLDQISRGISRDIHGFEKDRKLHAQCIDNLTEVARQYHLENIHWNIKRKNALNATKTGRYQFVVGNPPYVAYPELDEETRIFLRENFVSCKKGKPDYYYAFLESALGALAQDGKLIYLVPGNFMKNLFSDNLRKLLLPSLHHIVDYSHHKLFENVLTSSVILFCDMTNSSPVVHYEDRHYKRTYKMPKALMQGKWTFDEQSKDGLVPFSSCFHASAPVATQLNEAFVVSNWSNQQDDTITVNNFELEKSVLRDAAGPKALRKNAQEKIIFPYFYDAEGNVNGYSEEQFKRCFPGAYNYLLSYKERLLRRKADKNARWFEYGRSQLLQHLLQEKLVLSSFVTKQPQIYRLACDVVPYAGICVVAENNFTIIQAQKVLSSPEFMEYVQKIGVCTNGISYRISPTDINSFCFPHRLLEE